MTTLQRGRAHVSADGTPSVAKRFYGKQGFNGAALM